MKILLAVDGSPYTTKTLDYLCARDGLTGAGRSGYSISLLTVQPPLPSRARATLTRAMLEEYYQEEADKILAPVRERLTNHGIDVESLIEVGAPGEVIARVAEEGKYELIIMGTHGQGAWGRLVMGSVSTQVLANCSVPVLLIR